MKGVQKLYVYADESGQDYTSEFFVVVAVVSAKDQEEIRKQLTSIEQTAGTNRKKWHKLRHNHRMRYLTLVLERKVAAGDVYAGYYKKPIPYFFPLITVLEKAIKQAVQGAYRASIYVDGIDRKKAEELTNALRASGISLHGVKGRRDESEPLIRLADMWAGCMRSAFLQHKDARDILERGKKEGYLHELTT